MDMNQWKLVLFDWIKATRLIDVFGSLEHVQLDDFFFNFYHKIHSEIKDSLEDKQICDFLKETYPDYETLYDENNNVSSQDFVFVFSLLLHYSCIQEKDEYFQLACTKLNSTFQMCIATFFEYITKQTIFNKETLRTGIKQAAILTSPQTRYFSVTSPLKTPKKSDISPPTPSKDFINSKLKELKSLKTQLENERYERNMLETEFKQSQEKVDNLVKKCKDLNHEVQSLKSNSIIDNDSENLSPNKAHREYQIRRKMQKEIQHREDIIMDLKYEVENANATNKKYLEKINAMERQMNEMRLKIRELDASLDELLCNMTMKDQQIHNLEEERKELLEFINETRNGVNSKDISSDCLDFSCSTALYTTTSDLCESLAKSVVEVQLKEKENEIMKLNELLTSSDKIKNDLELKISELNETLKNLENEMNDVKTSKNKIFEEKSTEIQTLQNQLNSMMSKNKELQRDLDLKQKINLKMLKESDSHKNDAEHLQEEVIQLKEQIANNKVEFEKLKNDLKLAKESQSDDSELRKECTLIISKKSLEFDEVLENINCKIKEKDEKLLKLAKLTEDYKRMHDVFVKESEEKVFLKNNEISSLNIKLAEMEENLSKEKIFHDKLQLNNEVLTAKLKRSRNETKEVTQKMEDLRVSTEDEKRKHFNKMEEKLEGYKADMIKKYQQATAESKSINEKVAKLEHEISIKEKQLGEKDGIIKNFDLLINKIQIENSSYRHEIEERDRTIKNLTADLTQEKHEKEYINSKLQFLEGSESEVISGNPNMISEAFDNMFLKNLKNGDGFDDSSNTGSSSIFIQRNSRYPPHLRDSYAVGSLDKDVPEYEMKKGISQPNIAAPEPPTSENVGKKKESPVYRRPGPPTPSKNARYSINSSPKVVLKDTTNTECPEKISTPGRIKAFFSSIRSKDELRGYRIDKNNRTLTPLRSKNGKDKWIVEKDTDSDDNVAKNSRKEKELNRKEKRDKARDMNRPNLQDDSLDVTVCSNDSEWTEDDENNYERHSNTSKQDKSLEYIKQRENFRKRQQKMRRRSFNNNRKSSISKDTKILGRLSRVSSDDWDKFRSCRSLQSECSLQFNSTLQTPIKTCTRNYIESHFAEYNRMSDYQAPPPYRKLPNNVDDDFWDFNFKDIKKPVPLIVIVWLTICLFATLLYFNLLSNVVRILTLCECLLVYLVLVRQEGIFKKNIKMSESAKVYSLSMGRNIERSKSSSSFDSDDYFYYTRPEGVSSKCGTSGTPVKLTSNYFEIQELPNFQFTQYRVDFVPELDIAKIRNAFIGQQKPVLGGYIYDGASALYLTKEVESDTMKFECISHENKQYTLILKKTKNKISMKSKMGMMLLNVILRRAMGGLELQLLRRNHYDAKAKIMLNDYKLELWPGYVTSIRIHEDKILLCCEISHKVLRQETAYDVFERCRQESNDVKTAFKREIIGSVVITRYNNKTYRVDDVDFSKTASSTFDMKGQQKTFVQYYQEQYGIKINQPNQPLLITNPKPRDIRGGQNEVICLVPELCNTTGLTENMKSNFQLMKAMADYTRMDPKKRVERLMKFNDRMLSTQKSAEIFDQFQTKLQPRLVELTGRQLDQETILFGNGKTAKNDYRVDWTNPMKMNEMYANESLQRWGIIFPSRAANDTRTFLKLLEEVAHGMRYEMKAPKSIEISDDRVGTYAKELENFVSKDPKFIMVIVPNASADRYSAIKKITCVNNSIPTQVVVQKTMQPKKGNIGSVKSIATKVLIQMNCKLGGCAWMVNIPIKGLMTVGFDVSRDTSDKKKSYGAFVASMDLKQSTKFFSSVASHSDGEECSRQIANHMRKALASYMQLHGCLPQRILFYRDGVGEGDIERVHTQEVNQIQEAISTIYRSNVSQNDPSFAFIIVTKRINTRFFTSKGSNHENPTSGTVVDSVVTLPERYDFYLISQSVRQGTVSPTSYNVIIDNLGLTPDKIQQLTYKMCHLYYNWSGTTRVPCVLQYAQKLGVLVSQFLHQPPNELLNNSLYFL
ncbi:uncharacterized protein [Chironomus tepperi]|uniref:uncharacterized protein n=1 Tax=Chironomus tepperi TaxID=113505 RepID=UPI00391F72F8